MRAAQLKKRPRHFRNFTGLDVAQFERLAEAVKAAAARDAHAARPRQRAVGGGRKAKLALEDQLLVTLMYYRLYLTQLLLGYLFNLDDTHVLHLYRRLRKDVLVRSLRCDDSNQPAQS